MRWRCNAAPAVYQGAHGRPYAELYLTCSALECGFSAHLNFQWDNWWLKLYPLAFVCWIRLIFLPLNLAGACGRPHNWVTSNLLCSWMWILGSLHVDTPVGWVWVLWLKRYPLALVCWCVPSFLPRLWFLNFLTLLPLLLLLHIWYSWCAFVVILYAFFG